MYINGLKQRNHICGVMVGMLVSSVVDHGLELTVV